MNYCPIDQLWSECFSNTIRQVTYELCFVFCSNCTKTLIFVGLSSFIFVKLQLQKYIVLILFQCCLPLQIDTSVFFLKIDYLIKYWSKRMFKNINTLIYKNISIDRYQDLYFLFLAKFTFENVYVHLNIVHTFPTLNIFDYSHTTPRTAYMKFFWYLSIISYIH